MPTPRQMTPPQMTPRQMTPPQPALRRALALVTCVVVMGTGLSACAGARPGGPGGTASGGVSCAYPAAGQPSKPVDPPSETHVPKTGQASATLTFADGPVTITMNRAATPCTVNNFVSLAEQGWFTGIACHRLVDHGIFILQCGDPTGTGTGGPGYTFADELTGTETYPRGTVAMANQGHPGTNGSQFFLVWADTPLRPQYTVFGTMDAKSVEVVGRMAAQGVAAGTPGSPIADTTITQVTLG